MKRVMGMLVVLCCVVGIAAAQEMSFDSTDYEVLSASHFEDVGLIATLGLNPGGLPAWGDNETLYYPASTTIVAYHLNDIKHPTYIPYSSEVDYFADRPIGDPAKLPNPIGASPDGRYIVTLTQPEDLWATDVRAQAELAVRDAVDDHRIKTIMADGLGPRSYSGMLGVPFFGDLGLMYIRDDGLYRWTPDTDQESVLIPDLNTEDIIFSPDGHHAATFVAASDMDRDVRLRIWDLTIAPAGVLHEHLFFGTDYWHSLAISPDGQTIATAGDTNNIRFWDLATQGMTYTETERPSPDGHEPVVDMAYSPDGRFIATCLDTRIGDAFLRDAVTGEVLATVSRSAQVNGRLYHSVAFHPTENVVAFGAADGSVYAWPVEALLKEKEGFAETAPLVFSGNPNSLQAFYEGHETPVTDVVFDSTGQRIASASLDGTIRIWIYQTREPIAVIESHTGVVWSVVFHPTDPQSLIGASSDGTIRLWDQVDHVGQVIDTLTDDYVVALAISDDGTLLAGSTFGGSVLIWNLDTGERRVLMPKTGYPIWHLAFSPDQRTIATAGNDGQVMLWGVKKQK